MFQLATSVTVIDALLYTGACADDQFLCLRVSMTVHLSCTQSSVHLSCTQSSVHSDVVNSVSWGVGNKVLYSGASDCLIAEWSVDSGQSVRLASSPHSIVANGHTCY